MFWMRKKKKSLFGTFLQRGKAFGLQETELMDYVDKQIRQAQERHDRLIVRREEEANRKQLELAGIKEREETARQTAKEQEETAVSLCLIRHGTWGFSISLSLSLPPPPPSLSLYGQDAECMSQSQSVTCRYYINECYPYKFSAAFSSIPTNPHTCFARSCKALAMLVDYMWSFGWWLEGRGRGDSHKTCSWLIS